MILEFILTISIFIGTLVLIFTDKLNRAIAAMSGAVLMLLTGLLLDFYTEEEAIATIDTNTLGLLLGMMILVGCSNPPASSNIWRYGWRDSPKVTRCGCWFCLGLPPVWFRCFLITSPPWY